MSPVVRANLPAETGIDLRTDKPAPEAERTAGREILGDGRYRERARRLAAEYARYDAVGLTVAAIEDVARASGARN